MAKYEVKHNPRVAQVFEDLDNFLNFCRAFGYVYNEAYLYSNRSYEYRQYTKFVTGKVVKNNWEADAKAD